MRRRPGPPAEAAPKLCGDRHEILQRLARTHEEKPQALGLSGDGGIIEVLVSPEGGWTMLVTYPRRPTCIIAVGEAWQILPVAGQPIWQREAEILPSAAKMQAAGKPFAVICHAPWELVSAGLVRGRTLTSYPSIQDDIRNAGGNWVDREVVEDRNSVTSRKPDDLPAFNEAMLGLFARSRSRAA